MIPKLTAEQKDFSERRGLKPRWQMMNIRDQCDDIDTFDDKDSDQCDEMESYNDNDTIHYYHNKGIGQFLNANDSESLRSDYSAFEEE